MLASKKFSNLYYCELVMQSIDKEIFSEFLSSCVEDPKIKVIACAQYQFTQNIQAYVKSIE